VCSKKKEENSLSIMGQCMERDVRIEESTDCLDSVIKIKDTNKTNGASK
jgi:hypothetical protein